MRSVSRQTRISCIPRSDAPGRTSGSRRIHVPHDRRPTAPTSSTPSHAARRASRAASPPSGMPDRPLCRSPDVPPHRHARAAWSPAVNRAMNRYPRSPKSANTRRNIVTCEPVSGSPVRSPVHGRGPGGQGLVRVTLTGDPSPPRRTGVTVHRTRTTVDATVYSPHNPHVNASGCS